jgi:hypothetical protein
LNLVCVGWVMGDTGAFFLLGGELVFVVVCNWCFGEGLLLVDHLSVDDASGFSFGLDWDFFFHTDVDASVVVLEVPVFTLGSILAEHGSFDRGFIALFV